MVTAVCHRLMMMRWFRMRVGFVVVSVVLCCRSVFFFFFVLCECVVHRMQYSFLVEDGRARVMSEGMKRTA